MAHVERSPGPRIVCAARLAPPLSEVRPAWIEHQWGMILCLGRHSPERTANVQCARPRGPFRIIQRLSADGGFNHERPVPDLTPGIAMEGGAQCGRPRPPRALSCTRPLSIADRTVPVADWPYPAAFDATYRPLPPTAPSGRTEHNTVGGPRTVPRACASPPPFARHRPICGHRGARGGQAPSFPGGSRARVSWTDDQTGAPSACIGTERDPWEGTSVRRD